MAAKVQEGSVHTIKAAKALAKWFRYKNIPTYFHGPPGVGKSQALHQLADEDDIGFIDIRAGTKLPEDFSGIPVPDLEKRMAVWLKASFWPDEKRDGKEGIILFDELTDTSKPVQSCLYQVILDRRIGDVELPDGWWPCAAGNRRTDRAAAQALSTALANRFAHIDIEPDAIAFYQWAITQEHMGDLVPGFIRAFPHLLHSMEGADLRAFPTPRSWEQVAKAIDGCPPELQLQVVAALVGDGAAGEFHGFLRTVDLTDLEDIEKDPKGTHIPKELSSKWALTCMLSRYMTKQNIGAISTYIKRGDFGKDFEIACMLDGTQRDHLLTETTAFSQFAQRNQDLQL